MPPNYAMQQTTSVLPIGDLFRGTVWGESAALTVYCLESNHPLQAHVAAKGTLSVKCGSQLLEWL